jgi:hypothetical protein
MRDAATPPEPDADVTDSTDRGFLSELWAFMRREKKWWLVPLVVVTSLLLLAAVLGQSSALAPFIYSFI